MHDKLVREIQRALIRISPNFSNNSHSDDSHFFDRVEGNKESMDAHLDHTENLNIAQSHPTKQKNDFFLSSLFRHQIFQELNKLAANASYSFIAERSLTHLRTILLIQFYFQHKIEQMLIKGERDQRVLFLKLFRKNSQICCAIAFSSSYGLNREKLVNIFHTLLPGTQDIPHSFYTWFHPEFSYQFCYMELEKLRGKDLSNKDIRFMEKSLKEQLLAVPPLTPALFWPYNEEESFRQIQFLHREMQHPGELPHISILFQEQTLASLEFLVHYVRPKAASSLENDLKQLPSSFGLFWRFQKSISTPFALEIGAFSLKVPSTVFDVKGSINLLYARRYIAKYLEQVFGPFRDYNGGLFEKQQYHFEIIRVNLSDKIPLFDLFAEKVFYALHPIEARLSLSLKNAENLFCAFSEILQRDEAFVVIQKEPNVIVIKNDDGLEPSLSRFKKLIDKSDAHAQLTFGNTDYFCCLGTYCFSSPPHLLKHTHTPSSHKERHILRLSFQEGAPLSLNPHLSSGDMRCRLLSKLLFEGLMRLNAQGEPELAGAIEYFCSEDGLLYTFKLRPCYWSNGEKVTAIDYVASWQHALREYMSHPEQLFVIKYGKLFKDFKVDEKKLGVRALDANTLEIELEYPDPSFLYKLAQPFFFPLFGSMREPKWFNGPYLIRNRSREGLLLERNPYFWETRRAFFEQIDIKWLPDVESIYQLFQEGKTDWIGDPLSTLSPPLIHQLQKQGRLKTKKVNRRFLVHFNTRLPHLASSHIRHALGLSIKRSLICKSIFPYSTPLQHNIHSDKKVDELFAAGLKELNYTAKNYPVLKFSYSHQTGREKLASCLKSYWEKRLGVTVHLEKLEWNLFRNKLEKGEFEITATIQETLDNSPLEFLERFEGACSWNFSQWQDLSYREYLKQAREISNISKKRKFLENAEKILLAEAPYSPLFKCTHLFAHHAKLENYFFDAEGCVDFCKSYIQKENPS